LVSPLQRCKGRRQKPVVGDRARCSGNRAEACPVSALGMTVTENRLPLVPGTTTRRNIFLTSVEQRQPPRVEIVGRVIRWARRSDDALHVPKSPLPGDAKGGLDAVLACLQNGEALRNKLFNNRLHNEKNISCGGR
jgi:hypothetical protein